MCLNLPVLTNSVASKGFINYQVTIKNEHKTVTDELLIEFGFKRWALSKFIKSHLNVYLSIKKGVELYLKNQDFIYYESYRELLANFNFNRNQVNKIFNYHETGSVIYQIFNRNPLHGYLVISGLAELIKENKE